MDCYKCSIAIPDGEEREHNQKILCEDCYIDVLSPAKFCDPWASFNAQSFAKNNPETTLTENQMKINENVSNVKGDRLMAFPRKII